MAVGAGRRAGGRSSSLKGAGRGGRSEEEEGRERNESMDVGGGAGKGGRSEEEEGRERKERKGEEGSGARRTGGGGRGVEPAGTCESLQGDGLAVRRYR